MEIIHLILGKANPDRMNGVNKVVFQLASQQTASGRNVAVWGITKDMTHNYKERLFETRLFPASRNPFQVDPALKIALQAKKDQEVMLHLHGGWIPLYAGLSSFLAKHKLPFVLTPHGAYNEIARKRSAFKKKIYFYLFEQNLLSRAKKIHSIGQSEVSGLQDMYPNNKTFLMPYGYEAPQPEMSSTPDNGLFTIGFVGRLDWYTKGLDLLINAFHKFQQIKEDSVLWIIGEGEGRKKLEQMIEEKGLQNKVLLLGSKFGAEKDSLIQQMHVFTHPSRNEGLPSAVLEAAGLGIPCIVSKATNLAAYVEQFNAGIAINNEDVGGLEKAFLDMADQWQAGDLKKMSTNAQELVCQAFNWNHIVKSFDQLYQQ